MTSVISYSTHQQQINFQFTWRSKQLQPPGEEILAGPAVYVSSCPACCSGVWTSEALLQINIRKKLKTEPSCHPAAFNIYIYIERTLISISYSQSLEIFLFGCNLGTHHLNIQRISSCCQYSSSTIMLVRTCLSPEHFTNQHICVCLTSIQPWSQGNFNEL